MHSSSEPEVHSALEVTETDTSDLFHTADSVPIVKESKVSMCAVFSIRIFQCLYSSERTNCS